MEIGIGDIVRFKDSASSIIYVIVDLDIREGSESMCYDRDYYIMKLDDIIKIDYNIIINRLKDSILTQVISIGPNSTYKDIPFDIVTYIAPFKIEKVISYSFRQMKSKQITVYE